MLQFKERDFRGGIIRDSAMFEISNYPFRCVREVQLMLSYSFHESSYVEFALGVRKSLIWNIIVLVIELE